MSTEKLNLWDRLFNRYRRELIERKCETWCYRKGGVEIPNTRHIQEVAYYKVIDRLTGSEKIEKVFL